MENVTFECLNGSVARVNYLDTGKQINGYIHNSRKGLVYFDTVEGKRMKIEIGECTDNICIEEYEVLSING